MNVLFYRLLHSFHQRFPFFFRDTGSADVLLHQPGKRAVVILGQYFRQLLVDGFFIYFYLAIIFIWKTVSFTEVLSFASIFIRKSVAS